MTVLVQADDLTSAGVHALVIGVGRYSYLEGGGKEPVFPTTMGQLSSPPKSAEAFSEWLRSGLRFDGRPLLRLDVLASPEYHVTDFEGNSVKTEPPTFENVQKAVLNWKTHADANPDNVTVMFFCGHGLSVGDDEALLLEGFGDLSQGDHLAEAFNPSGLVTGMQSCAAGVQIFVFDACRNVDKNVADYKTGLANVHPLLRATPTHAKSAKRQAVIKSTQRDASAYATKSGPSRFTDAFIQAMRGAAATQTNEGDWVVDTTTLSAGVDWFMNLNPEASEQWVSIDTPTPRFRLHWLQGAPVVPVMVTCKPVQKLDTVILEHKDSAGAVAQRNPPVGAPWHVMLAMADYEFRAYAASTSTQLGMARWQPQPPKAIVAIPCEEKP